MATSFPKLPGYVPNHDCTKTDWKKVSHVKLEEVKNPKNAPVPLYALPRKPDADLPPSKDPKSLSYSQTLFKNPYGEDIREKFEPTFVKLDKQVLRFFGYFKESVTESVLESFKIRKVVFQYFLDDSTLSVTEPKQMNSGMPQGIFLKRQMALRSDGSGTKISPADFM
jgi:EF-hand domain-containing protein 1